MFLLALFLPEQGNTLPDNLPQTSVRDRLQHMPINAGCRDGADEGIINSFFGGFDGGGEQGVEWSCAAVIRAFYKSTHGGFRTITGCAA